MPSDDLLPTAVRRSLVRVGLGLSIARRRRRLTLAMMAERTGVTRQTYGRVEKGDPTVAMGTYVMAMFILGLEWRAFEHAAEPQADDVGTSLQVETLPKSVRPKRAPQPK
jgi:transcriptional regulator with XRE-family HTH domain